MQALSEALDKPNSLFLFLIFFYKIRTNCSAFSDSILLFEDESKAYFCII